ncbi:MAG: gliding motility-associated C-terminal domain-containing protein, partial [Bacteroidia bacterium]
SVIIDNHGCVSKDTFVVAESWFADYITLPNIITPNGDGKNDYLEYLNYDGCDFFQLDVFDRWGKRIATTNSPIKCWQGKDCSDGVYFYILKYTNPCEENTITERKGFIQLIR